MSQQNIIIAVCLVAASLAFVSCQDVNPTRCMEKVRGEVTSLVDQMRKTISDAIQTNTQTMQSQQSLQVVQQQLSEVSEVVNQMFSGDNGGYSPDAMMQGMGKLSEIYTKMLGELISSQSIFQTLSQNGFQTFATMSRLQMSMVTKIMTSCMSRGQ